MSITEEVDIPSKFLTLNCLVTILSFLSIVIVPVVLPPMLKVVVCAHELNAMHDKTILIAVTKLVRIVI